MSDINRVRLALLCKHQNEYTMNKYKIYLLSNFIQGNMYLLFSLPIFYADKYITLKQQAVPILVYNALL